MFMIPCSSVELMSNFFIDTIALPSSIEFEYEFFPGDTFSNPAIFFKSKCGHFWGNIRTRNNLSPYLCTIYYRYHKNEKYSFFSESLFYGNNASYPVSLCPSVIFIGNQFVKCGDNIDLEDDDVLIFYKFINYIYSGFDFEKVKQNNVRLKLNDTPE